MQQLISDAAPSRTPQLTVFGRKPGVQALRKWFLGGMQAPLIEFAWGSRDVQLLDNCFAVKVLPKLMAYQEFSVTRSAEEITDRTPHAEGLLIYETSGALATEYLKGIPLIVLSQQGISGDDVIRIRNGVFRAIGLIHKGDGKRVLVHNDLYPGNFLVMCDKAGMLDTSDIADIRIIDLEHSVILPSNKEAHSLMIKDLLFAIESLKDIGVLDSRGTGECLSRYLETNNVMSTGYLKTCLKSHYEH